MTTKKIRILLGTALGLAWVGHSSAQSEASNVPHVPPASESGTPEETGKDVVQMEAMSVTGSNIKRMDTETVLPVSVLSSDALDARNALQPINMITSLPEVTGVPANESASGGAGQRGDIATVNLRGLGSQFTLLLLNGRRLAPHPIISVLNFSPNASQYPNQGIDHIDVLRDGASSIYGTDAVAGVLNYVMKRDHIGDELKVKFAAPQHRGPYQTEVTGTIGRAFADGKGHFTAVFDYLYRDALFSRDRDFSKTGSHYQNAPAPFNVPGSIFDANGANPIWPIFLIGSGGYGQYGIPIAPSGQSNRYFYPVNSATETPSITTSAPSKVTKPWFYENLNASQMILPRTNRENFFGTLDYDIAKTVSFFSDWSFYHARTTLERQPQSFAFGADYYKVVSADNPFNPYGSYFYSPDGSPGSSGQARLVGTPQPLTLSSREVIEMGNEHIEVNDGLYRIVGGLKGRYLSTWTWESGILYTRASATDISTEIRESAFANSLGNTTAATAYNPFGYTFGIVGGAVVPVAPYTNPQSVVKAFLQKWRHEGFSSVSSIDLKTAGEVVQLWSGPLSFAAGGEFRIEAFADVRFPYAGLNPASSGLDPLNNDFITASAKPDSTGSRKVTSAYAETVIPLAAPKNAIPGVKSLELTGSGRFERYSDFGNTTRPKVGLNWKPIDGLMIRSSFNEGFSAPPLPLVNYGKQYSVDSQPGTNDPYRTTVTGVGAYVQQSQSSSVSGLQPSTSIGRAIGAVLDVPYVKGLTISADFWQINQSNIIALDPPSSTFILADDQARLIAYTQQQLNAGVPIDQINAGSGTSNYKGSPYVVRNAPSSSDISAFQTYNASKPTTAQQAVVGTVFYRIQTYKNLASGFSDGWDFSLNYALPKTPFGKFTFNSDWSYMLRNFNVANSAAGPLLTDNINNSGVTRWRGTSTLTWRNKGWGADLGAYYIGKFRDSGSGTTAATYAALGNPSWLSVQYAQGAYTYKPWVQDTITYNLGFSYRFTKDANVWVRDTVFRAGVINVWDTKPPLSSGNVGFDTAVYNQLAIGREFTFEITRHF